MTTRQYAFVLSTLSGFTAKKDFYNAYATAIVKSL